LLSALCSPVLAQNKDAPEWNKQGANWTLVFGIIGIG
jgi:hypothetical protein